MNRVMVLFALSGWFVAGALVVESPTTSAEVGDPPAMEIAQTAHCDGDSDSNGTINVTDLLALLGDWGDCPDGDGDGFTIIEGDCDDENINVFPGALEVCGDGIDNDCDGFVDFDDPEACQCPAGFFNCGSACLDIINDDNNCGACGFVCPAGFDCVNGICTLDCQLGLTDCSGLCVDLLSDENNCGSCGISCPAGTICVNGACVFP